MNDEEISAQLEREGIKLASFHKRAVAFMIDDMLISLLFVIIFWKQFHAITTTDAMIGFVNSLFLYIMTVKIIYQTLFVALYGATLGKMLMKIRVMSREHFDQPDFLESFRRALMRAISEIIFYIGFLWANFMLLREAWHDKFAKTLVVDV